ncbi:MAG: TonB-dependent receptor plug domain-containing protein [Gemmatimonadaceae bacterium]|nr:TonB-dependent receptor plug domain-containing protein [Gemmatimonadaceae bacterium]
MLHASLNAAVLATCSLGAALLPAQRPVSVVIRGTVVDSAGRPIPFANVISTADGRRVVATAEGRFGFQVDTNARSIEIRRIGFEPKVITREAAWPDSGLVIELATLPARLERVRVEAAQQIQSLAIHGFYERQAQLDKGINHGFVVTPEDLEQRKGARTTDFLHNRPGVRVGLVKEAGRNGRTGLQPQGLDRCRLEIYIDGIRFYSRPPEQPLRQGDINFINDLVPTSNIAAIEVYPRAVGAPPKYQSLNGSCGVMLIWTK